MRVTLCDTEDVKVRWGPLGGMDVKSKHTGQKAEVGRGERNYLFAIIEGMQRMGHPITMKMPREPYLEHVLEDFGSAILNGPSSFYYQGYFSRHPQEHVIRHMEHWSDEQSSG